MLCLTMKFKVFISAQDNFRLFHWFFFNFFLYFTEELKESIASRYSQKAKLIFCYRNLVILSFIPIFYIVIS
jgi:hypothetical protein